MYKGPPGWIGALGGNVPSGGEPGTFGTALAPDTAYWVSVVAVDTLGNTSAVANAATTCTTAVSANTNIYPIFGSKCNGCHTAGDPATGMAAAGPFLETFFASNP
jgi:hypothetical protein